MAGVDTAAACDLPQPTGPCRPAGPLIFQRTSKPASPDHWTSHSMSFLKGSAALPGVIPSSQLSSFAGVSSELLRACKYLAPCSQFSPLPAFYK